MKTVKVLLINYKFENKMVSAGSYGIRLKSYYENNSRGSLKIHLTYYTSVIGANYNKFKLGPHIELTKARVPKNFDYYVHFCNPPTSRAGGKHCITWASAVNTIHEFGHLLGLTHGNTLVNGRLVRSRDPYDCMTSFASYPSVNAPHRFLKGWYLPNEFVEIEHCNSKHTLGMLKNFGDRETVKILFYKVLAKDGVRYKRFFISLVHNKNNDVIAIHTIYGLRDTVLLNQFVVKKGNIYNSKQVGLSFVVNSHVRNKSVEVEFLNFEECDECNDLLNCETDDCELEEIGDDIEEDITQLSAEEY